MLTIKIIIWICKSEMGEPCEPPWLCFYGNNSPGIFGPHSVFLSDCLSHSHTQNPHFPNAHFRRAMFSSFFLFSHWAGYHGDDLAGHCAPLLTQRNRDEGNRAAQSPQALLALLLFLVQMARLKISPNYVLQVWPLSFLSEYHTWITMETDRYP